MPQSNLHEVYLKTLEPWVKVAYQYIYTCPDRFELKCYGTGYNGWGMQTHQKAFAAFAVLATDPGFDKKRADVSQETLIEDSVAMLRFALQSHIEGDYNCLDEESWGHTWISALGLERMMHGVEAIEQYLTKADIDLLRRVILSECDWLLDCYEIVAGPVDNNKPESNLWNGAILHRAAAMYPDAPRVSEYQNKGTKFLINSISVAQDSMSHEMFDGQTVGEWFVGDNFFESYALNHHGYLNVGYMVITLSGIAMLHFFYKQRGMKAPKALYHHAKELWALVKAFTFPDGRLNRIGGDTRVRYCYCQDYAIPVWLFVKDYFNDDCIKFESGWLDLVQHEIYCNADGTFLSLRCGELEKISPLYYTRLEADRAVTLSMGAYWHRLFGNQNSGYADVEDILEWQDTYHGACFVRGEKRIASWTWEGAEGLQGMCLPSDKSNLAEWRDNLAGRIRGIGFFNTMKVLTHQEVAFAGGFLTWGTALVASELFAAEQQKQEIVAVEKLVFVALPDDETVVVMQYATAPMRSYLSEVKGLLVNIPNDIFNGLKRTYYYDKGEKVVSGVSGNAENWDTNSSWINVDGCLGIISVYGGDGLSILHLGQRQIGIKRYPWKDSSHDVGMLCADEICTSYQSGIIAADKGSVLFDTGNIIKAGIGHGETKKHAQIQSNCVIQIDGDHLVRSVEVEGGNGQGYVVFANFGKYEEYINIQADNGTTLTDLVTGEQLFLEKGSTDFVLKGCGARVFVIDQPK